MLLGFSVTQPKSKTGPKFVLDPEEPGNKIGPRKRFSEWIRLAQKAVICKELQNRPKRDLGPGF